MGHKKGSNKRKDASKVFWRILAKLGKVLGVIVAICSIISFFYEIFALEQKPSSQAGDTNYKSSIDNTDSNINQNNAENNIDINVAVNYSGARIEPSKSDAEEVALNTLEDILPYSCDLIERGENQEAIKLLSDLLQDQSLDQQRMAAIQYNLAIAYMEEQYYSKAEFHFEQAIDAYPFAEAYHGLAYIYTQIGKYQEALLASDEAASLGATPELYFLRAYVYDILGQTQKSKENYDIAKNTWSSYS